MVTHPALSWNYDFSVMERFVREHCGAIYRGESPDSFDMRGISETLKLLGIVKNGVG